ncbi:MAG: MarR family transcriptional regulator [Chloroflexota bacterium]|nr:MarR family transcriptional regulator [Chloroflexota bacterium]
MTETTEPYAPSQRPRPLTARDPRLAPWRAFLTAHALVSRRLDDDLRAEHRMTLAEYAALLQLAESPDRRLRMNQLADGIVLSRSGVTRLIDRLEADGLVARKHCASDGRGAEAELTDQGLSRLRQASRTHLRGIEAYFLGTVQPVDLEAIERSCAAIRQRVRDDGRADAGGPAESAATRSPEPPGEQPPA